PRPHLRGDRSPRAHALRGRALPRVPRILRRGHRRRPRPREPRLAPRRHGLPEAAVSLTFLHAPLVHLAWPAAALVALLFWLDGRGRDLLGRFVSAVMQTRIADRPTRARRLARLGFVALALGAGIVALMRPQSAGGTEAVAAGRVSA